MGDYRSRILRAAEYIERHLREPLALEDVARHAGLSLYHFHRIFTAAVGDSLKEYIRKRRLTVAAERLRGSRDRIIDIALDAGFESQEAFSRAFKRRYGTSPAAHRRRGRPHHHERRALDGATLDHLMGGIDMEPEFRHKPAFTVVGLPLPPVDRETARTEIPALWQRFNERISEIPHRRPWANYGLCDGAPGEEGFRYVACAEVERVDAVPGGMVRRDVAARDYAVFTHRGPIGNIHTTIDYIWGSWVPRSGLRVAPAPDFERYDERFRGGGPAAELEIWVPLDR